MHHDRAQGYVVSVNVNPAGGVPKDPVSSAHVTTEGVVGDRQRHRRFHGGPMRAVCLYALEAIEALRREGHPIGPGTTGENLTLGGLVWDRLRPGDRLRIGDRVLLEITSYTVPCKTIAGSFADEAFTRIGQKHHPGWSRLYAKVIDEGTVTTGDRVEYLASGSQEDLIS